jgi:hypothetical protein
MPPNAAGERRPTHEDMGWGRKRVEWGGRSSGWLGHPWRCKPRLTHRRWPLLDRLPHAVTGFFATMRALYKPASAGRVDQSTPWVNI